MSRRRAHIAMVGVPIVSHVLPPSLALIRELVARGHRVTYANDPFVADQSCTSRSGRSTYSTAAVGTSWADSTPVRDGPR